MAEFRWIVMSSFLMLVLQFAATTEKFSLVGEKVTLSCKTDQDSCDNMVWLLSQSGNTVALFEDGKIHKDAEAKSDRLRVTKNCSLVIKNITDEDVGHYICRQFKSGRQVGEDTVDLSVVSITEQKDRDRVTLQCSVSTYRQCRHTVRWLYEGNQNDVETSQHTCSATVTFRASDLDQKSKKYQLLKCEGRDAYRDKVHLFTFNPPQSSGGDAATTMTTTTTTMTTTTNTWTSEETNTASEVNNHGTQQAWWRFITVSVGLAALVLIVVTVNMWTRTKGNKTQMEENIERNDEDEDEATVFYENVGEPSASVRLH